jgi:hypothetical protein
VEVKRDVKRQGEKSVSSNTQLEVKLRAMEDAKRAAEAVIQQLSRQISESAIKLAEEKKNLLDAHPYIIVDNYMDVFDFDETEIIIKVYDPQTFTTVKTVNVESDFNSDDMEHCFDQVNEKKPNYVQLNTVDGIGFANNFKAKITCPFVCHDFEIFPNKKEDHMSLIANFHMPCVRAYYNGNVYMTPSFITAHMTYMNIDYKYVAGSKDPLEIINKYRMRGFGTWLNKTEISTYIKYISDVPFWNNLFGVIPSNKTTYNKCLGQLQFTHKLFHPRRFNIDLITSPKVRPIPIDNPYEGKYSDIKSVTKFDFYNKLYEYYAGTEVNDIINCTSINLKDGYITPLKIHLIERIYRCNVKSIKIKDTSSGTINEDEIDLGEWDS